MKRKLSLDDQLRGIADKRTITFQSKYDAAQTNAENRRHWQNADALSPSSANSPDVRKILRDRARYERDNDPHLCGLIKTLAYDLVGTGPRLQLKFSEENYEKAQQIETAWAQWCRATNFADKLRILHEARPVDGESFAVLKQNPRIGHVVKLDLELIEADRVSASYTQTAVTESSDDGIEFDSFGNPVSYRILKSHPGDLLWGSGLDEAIVYPARFIIHWFRPTRPGQRRGVSELASCIAIGAQTRRYAQAVLTAAEFAAMLAGVMHTTGQAHTDEPPGVEALDELELVRGALLTLPDGYDAKQFKPEQPVTSYKEFIADKRNEIGRPVLAPFNVISGNSSGYNYSSGRLDHIPYHRSIWIERERMRIAVIDRVFLEFLAELQLVGLVDESLQPFTEWEWDWHWDGFTSIDPAKDAQASDTRLRLGLTTLSEECAAEGKNWRDVIDQQAFEKAYMRSKGLTPYGEAVPAQSNAAPAPQVQPEPEDAEDANAA